VSAAAFKKNSGILPCLTPLSSLRPVAKNFSQQPHDDSDSDDLQTRPKVYQPVLCENYAIPAIIVMIVTDTTDKREDYWKNTCGCTVRLPVKIEGCLARGSHHCPCRAHLKDAKS
jgi:hypothetical protein